MALEISTAATGYPLTLDAALRHLRVEHGEEDQYITDLIAVATEQVEMFTRRALMKQTWTLKLDKWWSTDNDVLELPKPPLLSVTSIGYTDGDAASQTWASSNYDVYTAATGSCFGGVALGYGDSFPDLYSHEQVVTITFVCGYSSSASLPTQRDAVPARAKQAIRLLLGHYYENRELAVTGTIITEIPQGVKDLMWGLQVPHLEY
jgi:uncharacterized phiE125 gp8 family phage protein